MDMVGPPDSVKHNLWVCFFRDVLPDGGWRLRLPEAFSQPKA